VSSYTSSVDVAGAVLVEEEELKGWAQRAQARWGHAERELDQVDAATARAVEPRSYDPGRAQLQRATRGSGNLV
jgi:hypothetical protein